MEFIVEGLEWKRKFIRLNCEDDLESHMQFTDGSVHFSTVKCSPLCECVNENVSIKELGFNQKMSIKFEFMK